MSSPPDQAPRLYAVLDQIAEAIGTQRVAAVVVDTEPNIWFARISWRFRPVIGIGLPLWLGLRPQERVAVLAHELGHGKNGDARHGWIVGSARSILSEAHEAFSRIVNATVGSLVRGYARLLDKADLRSSQRAEYLADRKAGAVAGSDATATALERLTLGETGYRALERALRFKRDVDPLEAVRLAVAEIPAARSSAGSEPAGSARLGPTRAIRRRTCEPS